MYVPRAECRYRFGDAADLCGQFSNFLEGNYVKK